MIGITLGDGSIPHYETHVRITLNKSEEPGYANYVKNLISSVFHKEPSIYLPKDANAIKFTITSREVVQSLLNKGLKSGDKKKNQVDVPQSIKENINEHPDCLRGLVDTDGSLHIHKSNENIRIGFRSVSIPLIHDFKFMCESNGIQAGKIRKDPRKDTLYLQIESKTDVVNFLNLVRHRKWEYRAETLGLVLTSISDKRKGKIIEKELFKLYGWNRVFYSKEYKNDLRRLCMENGYNVSKNSLINHIKKGLCYKDSCTSLSKEFKEKHNKKAMKIIKDLEEKWIDPKLKCL